MVTFGLSGDADFTARDITYDEKGCASFTMIFHGKSQEIRLQVPGIHNVANALASMALSNVIGVPAADAAGFLHRFTGTDRRFEYKGSIGGVTVIDDYAHHPT